MFTSTIKPIDSNHCSIAVAMNEPLLLSYHDCKINGDSSPEKLGGQKKLGVWGEALRKILKTTPFRYNKNNNTNIYT